MHQSNNSSFWAVLALILTAAAFVVSWKFIVPSYTQNQRDLAQTEEETTAAQGKLDSLKTAKSSIDGLGSIVDQILVAVPATKDTPNTISELEAIAALNKTYIPSFQISDSSAQAQSTTSKSISTNAISVAFSVSGSFDDLQGFVKSIENDVKFFNIKSMSVTAGDKAMSMSLQLEAYKQEGNSLSAR